MSDNENISLGVLKERVENSTFKEVSVNAKKVRDSGMNRRVEPVIEEAIFRTVSWKNVFIKTVLVKQKVSAVPYLVSIVHTTWMNFIKVIFLKEDS